MSHDAAAAAFPSPRENRAAMLWGIAVGLVQAATPLLIWWLDPATVYAIGLVVIAPIYVGLAVADGRAKVIAVESGVAFAFVVVAAAAVTGSPWLLVAGMAGHGLKDLWPQARARRAGACIAGARQVQRFGIAPTWRTFM